MLKWYRQKLVPHSKRQRHRPLALLRATKRRQIMSNAAVIGIVNQKGGTGKTTTCANLGIGLAREGKEVLQLERQRQKAKFDLLR